MPWYEFTEDNLLHTITSVELDAFRNAAKGPGEEDPVDHIIWETCLLVRGYCARLNGLEQGDRFVPGVLAGATGDLVCYSIMQRAGGQILDPHGARKAAQEGAMRLLEAVGRGELPIERPTTLSSEKFGTYGPSHSLNSVLHPYPRFDGEEQDGLT